MNGTPAVPTFRDRAQRDSWKGSAVDARARQKRQKLTRAEDYRFIASDKRTL